MRSPATRSRIALLVAGGVLVMAGCSSSSSVAPPQASSPVAIPGAPSVRAPAPGSAAVGPTASPSDSTEPNESPLTNHMVPALEDLLPNLFNGEALKKQSFDGTVLGSDIASRQLRQFLGANGKKPTDFAEAGASDPRNAASLTFVVFRVPGIDAALLQKAIVAGTVAASPSLVISTVTIGGRQIVKSVNAAGVRYTYTKNGLVYGLKAATQQVADQALALLP